MAAKKVTPAKTGPKTGQFQKGDDARRGHGLPGRSGRKPLAFVQECSELADDEVLPRMRAYITSHEPEDQTWQWCADKVIKYGKGQPPQTVTLEGNEEKPVFASPMNEILRRLTRLAPASTAA